MEPHDIFGILEEQRSSYVYTRTINKKRPYC